MAEEKRNCEWCVWGVVQKLFIFQLVVAPRRIVRALLHSQCPSAAARLRARAYLPKLQFIMCVKINILPVEKRGWLAFMNDLQSVSRIKGQSAESELLLMQKSSLADERKEKKNTWWGSAGVAFAENLFNTFERHVSLRLLRALDLSLQSLKESQQMTNSFYANAAGT
jgi:hypothetical protein